MVILTHGDCTEKLFRIDFCSETANLCARHCGTAQPCTVCFITLLFSHYCHSLLLIMMEETEA